MNYFKTISFLLLALLLGLVGYGVESIKIGLFDQTTFNTVEVRVEQGDYLLMDASGVIAEIPEGTNLVFSNKNASISLTSSSPAKIITPGKRRSLKLIGKTLDGKLKVSPSLADKPSRGISNNLWLNALPSKIRLINEVSLETYVSGVVEAESGGKKTLEYYKVQSIICRTYALANKKRHAKQGFHLCDRTHCQVYKGNPRFEPKIPEAVAATANKVIVDADINLIVAAFHSNCGGKTVGSGEVWTRSLDYLVGKPDTFCMKSHNSHWEKEMKKTEWVAYLKKAHKIATPDSEAEGEMMAYFPAEKVKYFVSDDYKIPMKDIRADLKLKSSFFNVSSQGDTIHIVGRGFGHGVGLCQEGAMERAVQGQTYAQIINHYFTNIHIIDLDNLDFFADE